MDHVGPWSFAATSNRVVSHEAAPTRVEDIRPLLRTEGSAASIIS